jgi:hypothetical protein
LKTVAKSAPTITTETVIFTFPSRISAWFNPEQTFEENEIRQVKADGNDHKKRIDVRACNRRPRTGFQQRRC